MYSQVLHVLAYQTGQFPSVHDVSGFLLWTFDAMLVAARFLGVTIHLPGKQSA